MSGGPYGPGGVLSDFGGGGGGGVPKVYSRRDPQTQQSDIPSVIKGTQRGGAKKEKSFTSWVGGYGNFFGISIFGDIKTMFLIWRVLCE